MRTPVTSTERRAAQLEAYKLGAAFHTFHEGLFWTRNNIVVLAHGGLLTAVVTVSRDKDGHSLPAPNCGAAALAAMGLILAAAWYVMVVRSRLVLKSTLRALEEAEKALGIKRNAAVFTTANLGFQTEWDKHRCSRKTLMRIPSGILWEGTGLRLSTIWQWVGAALAGVWLVVLLASASPTLRDRLLGWLFR
ncbi:MAG: hypothetical protein QM756_35295 [Polyangiaceae bacterium]